MKRVLLTPLSILAIAATASALTLDQPEPAAPGAASPRLAPLGMAADVERELSQLERSEASVRQELERLSRDSDVLRARTLARGRAYARLARAGLLPVGGGFDAFVEHAARLERLHRSLSRDLEQERQTLARRSALSKQLADITARRGPLQAQHRTLAEASTALLAAQDREQAFESAFMGGAFDDHTAVYGASPSGAPAPSSGFASLKGSLPFPLSGRSEIRSTRRGGSGPGLEMQAPAGAVVRAVFPGRVAFADSYADYGLTVILDHGGGYYTVSANLGEVDVKVGEDVKGGTRIASLGRGSAGSKLYFEVRIGQETADPAEWFGI
ncbi:MAG TPA: peptidoglycan DD-metalloendopeptidase family protein [Polyangiaceae bacterium]|nr:peptidoglycan DD-metalloendopeptidase family protein [Polyangiaceae bacterium]